MQTSINVLLFILKALSPFMASCLFWLVYWRFVKKIKPKKGKSKKVGHGFFLKKLLYEFPRQLMYDRLTRDPDFFPERGVHVIAGEQGNGKTVTLSYLLRRYQKMFPRVKVKTNFEYKYQDGEINSHKDIIACENGIYGEIDVIDEVQNWFNSLQSKDFPPEMMTEITQLRKQRKCIICTSQVFTRVAKPIREQTYLLYEPFTILGCLTVVFKWKPVIKADSGNPDKKKFRGVFFFVHNNELRENFDTYHKIEKMTLDGFKPVEQRISSGSAVLFPDKIKFKK